ncbi:MAG TPA: isochorismate synthase [Ignavibacteriaceae bacterium]|nr:isochorismate synthase [Ignavibacteriaceae bacterium]
MKDMLEGFFESLETFVETQKQILKNKPKDNYILSFVYPLKFNSFNVNLDEAVKSGNKCFYFEKPSEELSILAVDELENIAENGISRFNATDKKIKDLRKLFYSNWDKSIYPLFVGGMKYQSENDDDEWKDFNDSNWFIPAICFYRNKENISCIYNFYFTTSFEKVKKNFEQKFKEGFFSLTNDESQAVVADIKGNTPKDKKKWKNIINTNIEKILDNNVKKVVLSRQLTLTLSKEINLNSAINHLRSEYPECATFMFFSKGSIFFGATPELLAKFTSDKIEVDALAGSAKRGEDTSEDEKIAQELLNSEKNKTEHQIVIEQIKNILTKYTISQDFIKHFALKKLRNIQHIWSRISGNINKKNTIFSILKDLYPTPAICGEPKEEASNLIKKSEEHSRGLYSGIIGWFNFDDEGEFVIAIRSALAIKNKLYLYAGCGIIEDSNPDEEFKESELKFKPILSIFECNENK